MRDHETATFWRYIAGSVDGWSDPRRPERSWDDATASAPRPTDWTRDPDCRRPPCGRADTRLDEGRHGAVWMMALPKARGTGMRWSRDSCWRTTITLGDLEVRFG